MDKLDYINGYNQAINDVKIILRDKDINMSDFMYTNIIKLIDNVTKQKDK